MLTFSTEVEVGGLEHCGTSAFEDDRTERRRVQNREQPELLAGSPPSDGFSSLLVEHVCET